MRFLRLPALSAALLIAAATVLAAPPPAETPSGVPRTGAELQAILEACAALPSSTRALPEVARACSGYQAGVITGVLVYARLASHPAPFCFPDGTSDEKIDTALRARVGMTPEYPASAAVIFAIFDAFPCPK